MMDKFIKVEKEEFYDFVKSYPGGLERDIFTMPEPPLITYNDFKLGDWPESVVAKSIGGGIHYWITEVL